MDPFITYLTLRHLRHVKSEVVTPSPLAPPAAIEPMPSHRIPSTQGVTSQRLFHDGYSYSLKKKGSNRDTYRCARMFHFKCNGTLTCDKQQNARREGKPHNHPRNYAKTSSCKEELLHWLKLRAVNSEDPPSKIVLDMFAKCTSQQRKEMPKESSLKALIRKLRPAPPKPTDMSFEVCNLS